MEKIIALLVLMFLIGNLVVYYLKKFHIKSSSEWNGETKEIPFDFDINGALLTNNILIFFIFISICFYRGCPSSAYNMKDIEIEEIRNKYKNAEKYYEDLDNHLKSIEKKQLLKAKQSVKKEILNELNEVLQKHN